MILGKRNGAKVGLDQVGFEMGTPHKHYDVIVAWAAGEEIEIFHNGEWKIWCRSDAPSFLEINLYRIKPKRVKKEGWVNVYRPCFQGGDYSTSYVHLTKELADEKHGSNRVTCIRIEWVEEE